MTNDSEYAMVTFRNSAAVPATITLTVAQYEANFPGMKWPSKSRAAMALTKPTRAQKQKQKKRKAASVEHGVRDGRF